MPNLLESRSPAASSRVREQVQSFQAETLSECLLMARRRFGPEAEILSQRKIKKGALLGRWGGKEWMELTCRLTRDTAPAARSAPVGLPAQNTAQIQTLEARLAELTVNMQALVDAAKDKPFHPLSLSPGPVAAPAPEPETKKPARGVGRPQTPSSVPAERYPSLLRHLLDAEIALPLARQWIDDLPNALSDADARTELRTRLAQRLKIDARAPHLPRGQVRLMAFIGTTGVGKTTTIAKLAARYALMEHRRVGIITLDIFRVAASQQLQIYGDVLGVPVRVAQDKTELSEHLSDFVANGIEIVLLDTTGRSPNEMLPLGETDALFDGLGALEKYLTLPATLSARDFDHVVARFRHAFAPDALILTKLDEAIDSACFGKLLTVQAKYGLPLAYVTTGQKVPDDIAVPDAHAIAARIISTALI